MISGVARSRQLGIQMPNFMCGSNTGRDVHALHPVALDEPRDQARTLRLFDEGGEKGCARDARLRRADRLLHGGETSFEHTRPWQLLNVFRQTGTQPGERIELFAYE